MAVVDVNGAELELTGVCICSEPMEGCMSTLEAVASALVLLEPKESAGRSAFDALLHAFKGMVSIQEQFQQRGRVAKLKQYGGVSKQEAVEAKRLELHRQQRDLNIATAETTSATSLVQREYVFYTTQTDFRHRQQLTQQVYNAWSSCIEQGCSAVTFGDQTYYYNMTCIDTDVYAYISMAFAGTSHIVMDQFQRPNCSDSSYQQTHAIQDLNRCLPFAIASISLAQTSAVTATILDDGSVTIPFYPGTKCDAQPASTSAPDNETVAGHKCYQASKFYVSTASSATGSSSISWYSDNSTAGSSSNTLVHDQSATESSGQRFHGVTLVSTLAISSAVVLAVVVFIVWKWRSNQRKVIFARNTELNDSVAMLEPDDMVYMSKPVSGRTFLPQSSSTCSTFREQTTTRSFAPALSSFGSSYQRSGRTLVSGSSSSRAIQAASTNYPWEDDFVVASRIPRDKVVVVQLLSRGGFGVVYSGLYSGRRVAVKMLLPETRRSISHVIDLLAEVRMMASMEHPHIVEFIGVAWDSLTNMCVVSEFMAGGDLKALLSDYEEQLYPMGFNREKLKIALHIAHALTYMHSLDPPIIHRDLKSKNVLLSEKLDAKLTDFGTSRERVNESMTGGVGTCLWMAPEVMIGDRYDDKADMFSFGVVLSELDTHASPYWHAKDPNDSSRQMPEPAILQMVATGKLQVKFSKEAIKNVVALGNACVSVDPKSRPTATEALYNLHTILAEDVGRGRTVAE
ncbi:unnamed protein product [Phytophthora lilii]|uniref:Unnamed protein product n=1 Tax=Phytophthora lilii TaxID=2077276 RepID=A0A9W7DD92_9STRA|nr:unnamed protein product [Phytophthora lilii]